MCSCGVRVRVTGAVVDAAGMVPAFQLPTDFNLPALEQTGKRGDWVVMDGANGVQIISAGEFLQRCVLDECLFTAAAGHKLPTP